jgi:hypothetical protein
MRSKEEAEQFGEKIKSMVSGIGGLIYEIEVYIRKPNVISPSTVGKCDATVEILSYNVGNPKEIFNAHQLIRLGSMGADVQFSTPPARCDHHGHIEIHKRF